MVNTAHDQIVTDFLNTGEPVKMEAVFNVLRGTGHANKALVLLRLMEQGRLSVNHQARTITLVG